MLEHRRNCINNRKNKADSIHSNFHSSALSKEKKIVLTNCGAQATVWKDYNCSQTSVSQVTVRGEALRDIRWSDMKRAGTHSPEALDGKARCPVMGFIEQDHRKGKVVITKKKARGMCRRKE